MFFFDNKIGYSTSSKVIRGLFTIKGQPGEAAFEARYTFLAQGGDLEIERQRASADRWKNHEAHQLVAELVRYHAAYMDGLVEKDELSSYTCQHYQRFTSRFANEFSAVPSHTIEAHHLGQALDDWSKSSNAWNNALRALKHMFKYGKTKWGIEPDPACLIEKKPVEIGASSIPPIALAITS